MFEFCIIFIFILCKKLLHLAVDIRYNKYYNCECSITIKECELNHQSADIHHNKRSDKCSRAKTKPFIEKP